MAALPIIAPPIAPPITFKQLGKKNEEVFILKENVNHSIIIQIFRVLLLIALFLLVGKKD